MNLVNEALQRFPAPAEIKLEPPVQRTADEFQGRKRNSRKLSSLDATDERA